MNKMQNILRHVQECVFCAGCNVNVFKKSVVTMSKEPFKGPFNLCVKEGGYTRSPVPGSEVGCVGSVVSAGDGGVELMGDESVDTSTTTESVGGGRKDTVHLSAEEETVEDEGSDLDFEDTTEDTCDVAQLSFDN